MPLMQSVPVIYHWSATRMLFPFLPGLILLPFLVLRPNFKVRAWIVLIPFLFFTAIMVAGQMAPVDSLAEAFTYGYPFIVTVAGSLCILCLIAFAIPGWSRLTKWIAVPGLFIVPGAAAIFVQGVNQSQNWATVGAFSATLAVLLLSLVLAGRSSRKHWGLGRFSLMYLFWSSILGSGAIAILIAVLFLRMGPPIPSWWQILLGFIFSILMDSALLSIFAFPYILIGFLSPLYRERLRAAFGIAHAPQLQTSQGAV